MSEYADESWGPKLNSVYICSSRDREHEEETTEQVRSTRRHLRSRITQDGFTFEGEKYELKRNKVGKSQSHHHHP